MTKVQPKDRKEFNKLLNEMVDIFNGANGCYNAVEEMYMAKAKLLGILDKIYFSDVEAWQKDAQNSDSGF